MQYKAFISYSHAADGRLAPTLQSALQRFAKPWYRLRALRIFRDKTSLAATPSLWASIEQALGRSEYFLLLASPEAAKSPWIEREVQWWIESRSASTTLIVLTGGGMLWDPDTKDFDREISTALPPVLFGRLPQEPLYVDLSWARSEDHLSLRNTRFRDAILDLAATLHGKPKDELDGTDVREHRRTRRIAWSAAAALTLLTVTAIAAAAIAVNQQGIARSRELAASARTELAEDPELSLILARQAVEIKRTEQAEDALREALLKSNVRLVQRGRTREVTKAMFAGDDAVSVSFDGEVLVWDSNTGVVKHQFAGHQAAVCDGMIATAHASQTTIRSLADGTKRASLPTQLAIVDHLAFSPDCQWLATASVDSTARLYRADTGQPAALALEDIGILTRVHFSPDSRWLVTNRIYNRTDLWDVPTGGPVLSSPGHVAAFSPDGRLLVVGGADNTGIRFWDLNERRLLETSHAQPGSINSVQFSPDGVLFVTGGTERTARVWDSARRRPVAVLSGHTDEVVAADFSHDGRLIATASQDRTARIWVARSGELVAELRGHAAAVNSAVFALDDRRVLTASADGTARIWTTGMADPILRMTESGVPRLPLDPRVVQLLESASPTGLARGFRTVQQVAFTRDGRFALIATDTDLTEVWEPRTGKRLAEVPGTIAAFSLDGESFATAAGDDTVRVFQTMGGASIRDLGTHDDSVTGLRFSPDGRFIGTASDDKHAWIFSAATGDRIADLQGHTDALSGIWFSPDGSRALTASSDHTAVPWRLPGGVRDQTFRHDAAVVAAAFSPDGARVATADDFGIARVWEVSSGQLLTDLRGHEDGISDVHFAPGGGRLLTASHDGMARVWGEDGAILTVLRRHSQHMYRAVWSPDDRFIATGSQDRFVRLWEASTGRLVAEFGDHDNAVYDIAFSPDGAYLMSGSEDGTAHIYACEVCAPTDALLELAESRITRPPTELEIRTFGLGE
jgi:WD40 repeat protein